LTGGVEKEGSQYIIEEGNNVGCILNNTVLAGERWGLNFRASKLT
jgi:hypothetical protein